MSYKYTTRIRPLNLILIRSINEPLKYQSYEKPSTSLICFFDNFPFSNASTCIYCFHSHFRITWIQCMLLFWYFFKKKLFSHLFQETCLWFDLSASHSQFFTDSTLSVVIVTVSYLCVVEFVKASASAALHAALCALRVPLLWYRRSMFLAHLLKKCLEIMSLFSEVMIYAW